MPCLSKRFVRRASTGVSRREVLLGMSFVRVIRHRNDERVQRPPIPKHDGGPKVQLPRFSKHGGLFSVFLGMAFLFQFLNGQFKILLKTSFTFKIICFFT